MTTLSLEDRLLYGIDCWYGDGMHDWDAGHLLSWLRKELATSGGHGEIVEFIDEYNREPHDRPKLPIDWVYNRLREANEGSTS